MNPQDLILNIVSEDGEQKVSVKDYRTRKDLHELIGLITTSPADRLTCFAGTTIFTFPADMLEKDRRKRRLFEEMERMVEKNPLKYFVPQDQWALDFLNDAVSTCKILMSPNGVGKSTLGWVDILLDIVECDKDWPIFSMHGVNWRRFKGPYDEGGVGIVTYEWDNHITTIWPQIVRRWTPQSSLGAYGEGGQSVINWKSSPHIEVEGTPVHFRACSQATSVFESSALDRMWWDEQGTEPHFNGANMRVRRRNGRHVMTLTPHRLKERPDTGANSWIMKLAKGTVTAGMKVRVFRGQLPTCPSYIFSEEAKAQAITEWETEPIANNDIKKLREGRARLYGEPHETSGLVFDEWSPSVHLIDPFDIPDDWTTYRYVDHGRVEPTACLFVAVSPEDDIFITDEYYKEDTIVSENARRIIEASGSVRDRIGRVEGGGRYYDQYQERFVRTRYRWTRIDPRSMSKKTDGSVFTIGDLYKFAGLYVTAGDGQDSYQQIPVCKEFLTLDMDKKHYVTHDKGAPKVYIFRTCKWFQWEIAQYMYEEVTRRSRANGMETQSERPRPLNDHLMTCFRLLCMDRPHYLKGFSRVKVDKDTQEEVLSLPVDSITGY